MTATNPHSEKYHRDAGDGVELPTTSARGAVKTGRIRWVLTISVVLAVLALTGTWVWNSITAPVTTNPGAVASAPR